VRLSGRDCR